ncbi:MAG TPA: outer membrane beta-barrel protein [Flavobacterium sp.]|nr:outer membrane beta-barrel protein [Flavobacterium sp.]
MKKLVVAFFVIFGLSQAEAQVTFKPGIRGGVNFSHFTQGDEYYGNQPYTNPNTGQTFYYNDNPEFSSKTDFYVGLYGALHLTKYYTLQPEIDYSRQGSKVKWQTVENDVLVQNSTQVDVSYISLTIINKFTFNDKFNIHIGPAIDIITDKTRNTFNQNVTYDPGYYYYSDDLYDTDSDIDLSFVLGLGYNFTKNLGIEARIKKGIVPVLDFDDDHTNVVFSAGLNYTFDLK